MDVRPREDQPHYGEHLGDPGYWGPYVRAALAGLGLPQAPVETPFIGTFPTFLVGDMVVKLFGEGFDGKRSFEAEALLHQLLARHHEIPAPELIASGRLFESEPSWPYLITRRLTGRPVRDLDDVEGLTDRIIEELGTVVRRLHQLEPPAPLDSVKLLDRLRSSAPERVRHFGLPEWLVAQVADYLGEDRLPGTLVHGDITRDHVFVRGRRLEGIIDWGDVLIADPYYELVAVYLDALRGSSSRFRRFLDAYGWGTPADFPRRALQALLSFQFDWVSVVRHMVDLRRIDDLDELADRLYGDVV
jgi:aminoglycoside phosphotransferase (APT) family kinase protein